MPLKNWFYTLDKARVTLAIVCPDTRADGEAVLLTVCFPIKSFSKNQRRIVWGYFEKDAAPTGLYRR